MSQQLIKLYFQSPLHLSKGKGNQESSFQLLHSDTLKSAIYYNAMMLFGEDMLTQTGANAHSFLDAFKISSAFPFYKGKLFFPKPQLRLPNIKGLEESKQRKGKKKIKFLNLLYFEALLHGDLAEIDPNDLALDGSIVDGEPVLKSPTVSSDISALKGWLPKRKITSPFMHSKVQQKVMVPRAESVDTDTYYMERIYFQEGAGLFFLIEYDDQQFSGIQSTVEAAIQLLGENGIGSDRHTGNGHFKAEFEPKFSLSVPDKASKKINLSLFCPTRTEASHLSNLDSAYTLLKRGGFIASPAHIDHITYRKKSIYMIGEGSVFPNVPLEGKLTDLKPAGLPPEEAPLNHPIWRDGRAIFLPVNA